MSLPRDARLGLLARREDVGDDGLVGERERLAELALQVARAREQVRLEHGDDPSVLAALGGGQRGRDLGGVVGVVVHHEHAGVAAELLEAARGAAERREVRRRVGRRDAGVSQDGQGRERVEDVVLARHPQAHPGELDAALAHRELAAAVVDARHLRAQVAGLDADASPRRARVCAASSSPPLPATRTSRPVGEAAGRRSGGRRRARRRGSRSWRDGRAPRCRRPPPRGAGRAGCRRSRRPRPRATRPGRRRRWSRCR